MNSVSTVGYTRAPTRVHVIIADGHPGRSGTHYEADQERSGTPGTDRTDQKTARISDDFLEETQRPE